MHGLEIFGKYGKFVWDSRSNINNSVISRSFCLAASIDVAQAQNVCQRCWLDHRTYTHMNMMTDKQINRDENNLPQ